MYTREQFTNRTALSFAVAMFIIGLIGAFFGREASGAMAILGMIMIPLYATQEENTEKKK
jgi:hypothetical protein